MSSTPEVDLVKFAYNPGPSHPHMKEEYWVVCNEGMADKWRKDESLPLVDVLQVFEIYAGTGKAYRPSHVDLENAFDVRDMDEIIKRILREGKIVHKQGFLSRPFHS